MVWESTNVTRRKEKTTILTFDYSKKAGLIACGGVEGQLLVLDPSAKLLTAQLQAHTSEILSIFFYDRQMQMVSVSIDRTIMLWDSLKLECIQMIKDENP